jgi:pimeloyl-ACP methyl ester carboxylesterase
VVADDMLRTPEEIAPLEVLPCPITLAWSGEDAVLPVAVNGAVARRRLPHADFVVLEGVGHVPMIDDAASVARTILATTGAAPHAAPHASAHRSTAASPTVQGYASPAGGPWWS